MVGATAYSSYKTKSKPYAAYSEGPYNFQQPIIRLIAERVAIEDMKRGIFMGLFDIFKSRKQNADNTHNEWTVYAKKMCDTAIEYANEFQKKLDYSENSIADLEEILDWYSNDIAISKPTENQIWSMAMIFGSYLGETLLKNGLSQKGFIWGKEPSSNIPLLIRNDGAYLTPNDKVYKRLVNGSEDSVVSFYRFATTEI